MGIRRKHHTCQKQSVKTFETSCVMRLTSEWTSELIFKLFLLLALYLCYVKQFLWEYHLHISCLHFVFVTRYLKWTLGIVLSEDQVILSYKASMRSRTEYFGSNMNKSLSSNSKNPLLQCYVESNRFNPLNSSYRWFMPQPKLALAYWEYWGMAEPWTRCWLSFV